MLTSYIFYELLLTSLLTFQNECEAIEQEANEFFTDEKVLQRLEDPKTYFQKISTVAFKPVSMYQARIWHKNVGEWLFLSIKINILLSY